MPLDSSPRDEIVPSVCAGKESVMAEHALIAEVAGPQAQTTEVAGSQAQTAEPEDVAAQLLVEEVSIDGMCGVY
jgi:mycofactocin precursor